LKLLNQIVFYATKILQVIGNIVLAAILLMITAGIISRYIFGQPFSWTEELATFLMVIFGYTSGAIVTVAKKHIVADFLINKAPPKFQRVVAVFGQVLAIAVFLLICIGSYPLLARSPYRTAALKLPRHLFYIPVFSLSVFMAFAALVDILNGIFPGYEIKAEKDGEDGQAFQGSGGGE
jgi:TRAP-type C4-dicarboxylate transport system permease small subunit